MGNQGIARGVFGKMKKVLGAAKAKAAAVTLALTAVVSVATSAHAAESPANLETATTMLTDGVGQLSTQTMVIIGVVIAFVILVFGTFFLMKITKRGAGQASN